MKLRWRGHLNMKDIVERALSGMLAGIPMGVVLFFLTRWFA